MILSILQPIWPIYSVLRVLIIFIDMVLVFVIFYAGVELHSMRPHFVYDPRKPIRKHAAPSKMPALNDVWQKLREEVRTGAMEAIHKTLIEADRIADNELKKRGYEGDTFADRLSKLEAVGMETLDRVWNSHRLRNDIIHTPGFEVSLGRAEQAMDDYEAFLKEIGALKQSSTH